MEKLGVKMSKNRIKEYKSFEIDSKTISESGEFEGYGAWFDNIDFGDDKIQKGAFKKTLKEKKTFPLCSEHGEIIGICTPKEDEKGLFGKFYPNMEVQKAREQLALARQGAITKLSIGYQAIKYHYENIKNKSVRVLTELKLYEISMVGFPMNDMADITDVKSNDNIFEIIKQNKDKEGFKEKILSLFEDQEPEIKTIPEIEEKSKGLDIKYILEKIK